MLDRRFEFEYVRHDDIHANEYFISGIDVFGFNNDWIWDDKAGSYEFSKL